MKTTVEIKEELKKFILETTFAPAEQVQNETLIFEQGIFDSLGFISLITFIEKNFQISPKDSELLEDNFESIDAMTRFIESKLN
ncbi:MAG: acyl carrier protein [Prolixibacteraceae bacterium]|nr:acyl carrier protein [Prolixibacteraceae bacterium]MBN2775082.1 acyl carrier protein [Prolixibacteraceae bacterium]